MAYRTLVPIINDCMTAENRADVLALLTRAQADEAVLTFHGVYACDMPRLTENIAFLRENGLDVSLWVGHTFGHTGDEFAFAEKELPFQRIVRRDGAPFGSPFCPLDRGFQTAVAERLAAIAARSSVRRILLDDDCCLAQKGFGCTCEAHMARLRAELGEDISREELTRRVFCGRGSRYRDAWRKVQGESILEFARALRAEMNRVCPGTALGVCTVFSHWSFDGVDALRLTETLAGDNPRFLRLHGAPYWSAGHGKSLAAVCETARMFASFCRGQNVTLLAEGDVYPRPRTNCPASRLSIFDAVIRADGAHDGILKYMLNYTPYPMQETGYVERHARDLPKYEQIGAWFAGGANAGVRVWCDPHPIRDADLDRAPQLYADADPAAYPCGVESPRPIAGGILSQAGIPTVYGGEGVCTAVFGEDARYVPAVAVARGAILDSLAARILAERGIDTGIRHTDDERWVNLFSVREPEFTDGDPLVQGAQSKARLCTFALADGAAPVLLGRTPDGDAALAYQYENKAGQRFLVLTADAFWLDMSGCGLIRSYAMQRVWKKYIPWVACRPLPAACPDAPGLYLLCREDADSLSLLIANLSEDVLADGCFTLPRAYSHAEFTNCAGRIEGDALRLTEDLPAFSFAAVRLSR